MPPLVTTLNSSRNPAYFMSTCTGLTEYQEGTNAVTFRRYNLGYLFHILREYKTRNTTHYNRITHKNIIQSVNRRFQTKTRDKNNHWRWLTIQEGNTLRATRYKINPLHQSVKHTELDCTSRCCIKCSV